MTDSTISMFEQRVHAHRQHSEVSVERHIRQKRLEVGEFVARRKRIYLDTRYWIFLRDAAAGRPSEQNHSRLLELATSLVDAGKAVFPISETAFIELMKQPNQEAKDASARVVDRLSCGIALCSEDERVPTEMAHVFYTFGHNKPIHPLNELVWVRLGAIFGLHLPGLATHVPEAQRLAFEKAFIDHAWDTPARELFFNPEGAKPFPMPDFAGRAKRLNEANKRHAHDLQSYAQTYVSEVSGVLDLYKVVVTDVMEKLWKSQHPDAASLTPEERQSSHQAAYSFLVQVAEQNKGAAVFPALHIQAKCHAAIRWDQKRRLKGNDLPDIHHAAAALPYFSAFFTETPLRVMLTSNHVRLDREFDCAIISDEAKAVAFLKSTLSGPSEAREG